MSYECTILRDSVSEAGHRLTTFQITFPRFILAEVNTHRMLSRNSASSRAIPIDESIQAILDDMFVPKAFGAHQKGMQASKDLDSFNAKYAAEAWRSAGASAMEHAHYLKGYGVHKAWANRLLEPFKWHTAIVTATEWGNFFALRDHPDAQPEFQEIAHMMREQYESSTPLTIFDGSWALPLIGWGELRDADKSDVSAYWERWKKVSIGRCARVSVEQHNGTRDPEADIGLHDRLEEKRHLSPFEHVARPFTKGEWRLVEMLQGTIHGFLGTRTASALPEAASHANYLRRLVEFKGNLRGWHSARMDVPHDHDFSRALALAQPLG